MTKSSRGRSIHPGGFAALPNAYFKTSEFAALSGVAVKLLVELALQYNRANNGDLTIVHSKMKDRGFRSTDQLMKARNELINAGWIMVTRQGGRNIPSLYAITWEPIDRCNGKLDVPHGPTPLHLWKPQNAEHRERKQHPGKSQRRVYRHTEQVAPPHGTALYRDTEQEIKH